MLQLRKRARCFLLTTLILPSLSNAQSELESLPEAQSPQSTWIDDSWEKFKSPLTTPAKYALISGGALLTTVLIFEDQIVDPTQEESVEHKPLGKFSKYGDLAGQMIPNALYTVGMLSYGYWATNDRALQNSYSMFQSTLFSVGISTVLKAIIREPRPNNFHERNSFPSGHTTSAFAFASYVGCRHSWPWGLAAYSLAGLVGYSRINDNRHFLHDVVAGATIGESFGLGICLLENSTQTPNKTEHSSDFSWYFAPAPNKEISGGFAMVF